MNTVQIRNLTLGDGKPAICLPIVGHNIEEIYLQAHNIIQNPVDIIEWRADWFENLSNAPILHNTIAKIRSIIGDIPLLFTIRTAKEGGEVSLSFDQYMNILKDISSDSNIDAIDVEILSSTKENISTLISSLKTYCVVIASSHNFSETPSKTVITERLSYMHSCGADVCKMAVMPNSTEDVLTLLSATNEAHKTLNCPIITMSMGSLGLISRLSGEVFGSALTFGCVGKASAPGQIDAKGLNVILETIHNAS